MSHWRFVRFTLAIVGLALLCAPSSIALAESASFPPADGYLSGCTGEYYNNITLTGSTALVRTDGAINFAWAQGASPGGGVSVDNYSVRWTCTVNAPSTGNYTFTATTDDGMNILVDGTLILWAWYDQGVTTHNVTTWLNAGSHTVKVEYYNKWNAGTAQVTSSLGTGSGSLPPPPAPAPAPSAGGGYLTNCIGEYFNNTSVTGSPALTRTDGSLNFFWGENVSPGSGVNNNNYSVRWTCTVNAPSNGNYSFTMTTDDGMNLLVDGGLVVWAWWDQGSSTYSGTVYLNAGAHTVKVEYYNKWNAGTAQVTSSLGSGGSVTPTGNWTAQYYNNQSLSGAPVVTRNEAGINYNWGGGSPDPSVPADHFSARWTQTAYFNGGTWRFTAASDDGVRLWVDSTLLIDRWFDQSYTGYNADIALSAGNHTVRLEYYDNIGAAAVALAYGQLSGGGPPPPPPPPPPSGSGVWHGQYFNNLNLSGSPAFVRDDYVLNFNWGEGAPFPGVTQDFSAKWDSTQNIPVSGACTINATSDDGVRVWVDGNLIIDGWWDHGPTLFTATPYLNAGAHTFHVEYYDRTLGAQINVQVCGSIGLPPPPPGYGSEVLVDDQGSGWQAGGLSPWYGAFGVNGHAYWALNHAYNTYGYNWARWYPALTGPGNYEVLAYIPGGFGSTLYGRYWIRHGNRYDLAVRPQGFFGNQWMSLGTYYFNAAGGEYVSLADVTYECYACRRVAFDAIKFSPR